MPQVSPQQQAARAAIMARLETIKGWLEAEDLETVAKKAGLALGTVKQVKKGSKWNTEAAKLLIEQALLRKSYYEKTAGVLLDEKTGEPV